MFDSTLHISVAYDFSICVLAFALCNSVSCVLCSNSISFGSRVLRAMERNPQITALANSLDDYGGSSAYHLRHVEGTSNASFVWQQATSGFEEPARPMFGDVDLATLGRRISQLESTTFELDESLNKLNSNLGAIRLEILHAQQVQRARRSSNAVSLHPLRGQEQPRGSSSDDLVAPRGLALYAVPVPPGLVLPSPAQVRPNVGNGHGKRRFMERRCVFSYPGCCAFS